MGRPKPKVSTPSDSTSKSGGQPSPLDKTERPTLRQVIQYSYFPKNSHPDYDIAKVIATYMMRSGRQ